LRTWFLSTVLAIGFVLGAHAQTPTVTATCKDGTSFSGTSRRGACAGHGGVQSYGTAPAAAETGTGTSTGASTSQQAPAAATGTNKQAPAKPTQATNSAPAPGGGPGQVWVNSSSKVYHCPGDRYYGKTKSGSYMTEAAAKAAGDRPADGKTCS
jgi:hypothetical protein